MHSPLRVVALVVAEPHAAAVLSHFDEPAPPAFPTPQALLSDAGVEPGVVFVGPGISLEDAVALAGTLRARDDGWAVVRLEGDSTEDLRGRAISVGWLQPIADLVAATRDEAAPPILELGVVLRHLSRARHDINNPLTSALAETQLLLMDVEDGEIREALETIQRQIRRIRDMVADLSALRPPR